MNEDWDSDEIGHRILYKETSAKMEAFKAKLPRWLRWLF